MFPFSSLHIIPLEIYAPLTVMPRGPFPEFWNMLVVNVQMCKITSKRQKLTEKQLSGLYMCSTTNCRKQRRSWFSYGLQIWRNQMKSYIQRLTEKESHLQTVTYPHPHKLSQDTAKETKTYKRRILITCAVWKAGYNSTFYTAGSQLTPELLQCVALALPAAFTVLGRKVLWGPGWRTGCAQAPLFSCLMLCI